MERAPSLELAREAHRQRRWEQAYAAFTQLDARSPLDPADLELAAVLALQRPCLERRLFQHALASSMIRGLGPDAGYIADHLAARARVTELV
jgi:hypothetical protein